MKKVILLVLALTLWATIGFFNYGYTLGYFTNEFPDQKNIALARFTAMMGPMALPAIYLVIDTDHWLLKPYTKEQRWQAFHERYPDLSRKYFEETDN